MSKISEKYRVQFGAKTAGQLFKDICYVAFKHEVHRWMDEVGTDGEKLEAILAMAREGLFMERERQRVAEKAEAVDG
ncbi:MAG: hypothetical protein NTZ35_00260 [Ignavibacteriales bacterium]|nr:hypothetical protein [Ignavibacteriales bacterium]